MKERDELQNDGAMLFFFGAAFGILVFLITYGSLILNINYDTWILKSQDLDIKQHYIGFLHYLNAPWTFPFGRMDSLSYPYVMSVVWTDSIPGLCVLAKIFKGLLPAAPQLFGWFGLLVFALNGGFSALLLFRVTKNRALSLFSSLFFIMSFPVLQRLYYHTSLAAHFIILAVLLWFYNDKKRKPVQRHAGYAFFAFLCVSVHSYFLPAAGVVLFADAVKTHIREEKRGSLLNVILRVYSPLLSFCAAALFSLYAYGAFSMPVNHGGFAVGEFNSNLNTFFNSLGDGLILKFTNKYHTQYEGFGYLGLGMLVLSLAAAVLMVKKIIDLHSKKELKSFIKAHDKMFLTVCMFIIFFIMAVIPEADLNEFTLIPDLFPHPVKQLLGVFRSNGRFIWGDVYIIMLSSVYIISKTAPEKAVTVMIILSLLLQIADTAPYIIKKREIYTGSYADFSLLEKFGPPKDSYDHIIMTFDNGDFKMNFAYYAALDGKTMNRFYFARDIDEAVNDKLRENKEKALSGQPEERTVYVFNAETMEEWAAAPLHIDKINDDLFFGYKNSPQP